MVSKPIGGEAADGPDAEDGKVVCHHRLRFVHEEVPDGEGPEVVPHLQGAEECIFVKARDAIVDGHGVQGWHGGVEDVEAVDAEDGVDGEVGDLVGDLSEGLAVLAVFVLFPEGCLEDVEDDGLVGPDEGSGDEYGEERFGECFGFGLCCVGSVVQFCDGFHLFWR